MKFDHMVLARLVYDETYARKVLPFLKSDYFQDHVDRAIFSTIDSYVKTYNRSPSKEAITIDLEKVKGLSDDQYKEGVDVIQTLAVDTVTDIDWMVDKTESFCKDKAVYNAIMESIQILDDEKRGNESISAVLEDALAVTFDTAIGLDFIEDIMARYDFYHTTEKRIRFKIDYLNKITAGGLLPKTLTVLMAGTGVGKTLAMCDMAAGHLLDGLNVLYITNEMSEQRIAERIDANLMNVTMDELRVLPRDAFEKKAQRVKARAKGRLIIKEYPTSTASAANFRYLLHELKLKKNFIPDVIYVDYINICASYRLKGNANANSYTVIKAIAEELRGLAVEFNVPLVTATQVNREGYKSSDFGLEDTAESFGLPATADLFLALIQTPELAELNHILFKQLKNRYGDIGRYRTFVVGVDKSKMQLYDVEDSAQAGLHEGPVMDNSKFGQRTKDERPDFSAFDGIS